MSFPHFQDEPPSVFVRKLDGEFGGALQRGDWFDCSGARWVMTGEHWRSPSYQMVEAIRVGVIISGGSIPPPINANHDWGNPDCTCPACDDAP